MQGTKRISMLAKGPATAEQLRVAIDATWERAYKLRPLSDCTSEEVWAKYTDAMGMYTWLLGQLADLQEVA